MKGYPGSRLLYALAILLIMAHAVISGERMAVAIRIQAANPSLHEQPLSIRYRLPRWLEAHDVINLDGLQLERDDHHECFFLVKDFQLKPKTVVIFNPVFSDVWSVPQPVLADLRLHLNRLIATLSHSHYGRVGSDLAVTYSG